MTPLEQLRAHALSEAIKNGHYRDTPETVVQRAEKFYDFLRGAARTPVDIDRACEVMHDAYEDAAAVVGWETQERSRKPWDGVPEANKDTMRAAVGALVEWIEEETR